MNNQNMFKLVSYFSYDPCKIVINAAGDSPEQEITLPHGARLDVLPVVAEGLFEIYGCLHQASDGKDPSAWRDLDGNETTPVLLYSTTTEVS